MLQALALENARQNVVLLSNPNKVLPLNPSAYNNIAVIGPNANGTQMMLGNYVVSPSFSLCSITAMLF